MVNALWRFASNCYLRPGLAEICLRAQDEYGADVNMVLAAAWIASQGIRWESNDVIALAHLCADWRSHCLEPLRSVRRYLKHTTGAEDMYAHIKGLELEAERQQLQLLEAVLGELESTDVDRTETLNHNLNIYFKTLPSFNRIEIGLIARLADLINIDAT
jgi:uncharacterized protein (TIGR02444 family)